MIHYADSVISVLFGDKSQFVIPSKYRGVTASEVITQKPFSHFKNVMTFSSCVFLNQVHKADGYRVITSDQAQSFSLFTYDGDYLITNVPHVGIGVVTADCLSIVYKDSVKKVIGVAHAGWRGSVAGIARSVVKDMKQHFDSEIQDITVLFGPSIKKCCYEVDALFVKAVECDEHANKALFYKDGSYTFDLSLYNELELISIGLSRQQLVFDYHMCTLCNENFCSYRRDQATEARQVTVVSLK